jgi:hypothetical protein
MEWMKELAGILLLLSIALAWLLVLVRYLKWEPGRKLIRDDNMLLKAHIDYFLMSMLLFVFYLVGKLTESGSGPGAPEWALACLAGGTILNPAMFLVMAAVPDVRKTPASPFGIVSVISFLMITCGVTAFVYPQLFA